MISKIFHSFSTDSPKGPWNKVLQETLEDSRQQKAPLPLQEFSFPKHAGRYVKFEEVSYYGKGGGLAFFNIIGVEKDNCTRVPLPPLPTPTPPPTTTTTTTTTTTEACCMRMDIVVRNSQDNKPVTGATLDIHYEPDTGEKVEVAKNLRVDAHGKASLEVTDTGKYGIKVSAEGFLSSTPHYTMRCLSSKCDHVKLVTLSPELRPGQTRIMMTWEHDIPKDLDIRVISVRNSNKRTCKTNYSNKDSCSFISMDRDNQIGGNNGSETITLLNNNVNKYYTYVIGVEEYGLVNEHGRWADLQNQGQSFLDSGLEIRITNNVKEVEKIMVADSITPEKE